MKRIATHGGSATLSRSNGDVSVLVVVTWYWDEAYIEPGHSRNGGGNWRCGRMCVIRDDGSHKRVTDISGDEYDSLCARFHPDLMAEDSIDFYEGYGVRV